VQLEELVDAILRLDESTALKLAREWLEVGGDPLLLLEAVRRAAQAIGERYERGELFVADLVMAGEILKEVSELVRPLLRGGGGKPVGRLVIGTVQGDIHDIGKNIVVALAEAAGFEVIDLGVDVPPEKFVEAVRRYEPDVVGLSGLLSVSIESMKLTVKALEEAGLRGRVKVIIGGGRVDEEAIKYTGADAWADSAAAGVKIMLSWVGGGERGSP